MATPNWKSADILSRLLSLLKRGRGRSLESRQAAQLTEADLGNASDISVFICHPWGDFWVSLERWIHCGPGLRYGSHPSDAKRTSTGEPLPLSVIPLQYRNDEESRRLIRLGLIENPWPYDLHVERDIEPDYLQWKRSIEEIEDEVSRRERRPDLPPAPPNDE